MIVMLAIAIGVSIYNTPANRLSRQMDLGRRYLEEQDYEQAVIAFTKAIDIDPMSEEAYIGLGDYETMTEILQRGYDLTNDERLKQKYNILIENTRNKDTDLQVSVKDMVEIEFVQELEHLAVLLEKGYSDTMFQFEECTFLGHDINNMNRELFLTILTENGYHAEMSLNHPDLCQAQWFPNGISHEAPSINGLINEKDGKFECWIFKSYTETEEPMPIGVRDIYTHDTLEEVLTTLGFTNGKEIANYINEVFTTKDYGVEKSYEDLKNPVFEVSLRHSNLNLYFSFTGVGYDHREILFDYKNEKLTTSVQNSNVDVNNFDSFILTFYFSKESAYISFHFNQYKGLFMYLNQYRISFL